MSQRRTAPRRLPEDGGSDSAGSAPVGKDPTSFMTLCRQWLACSIATLTMFIVGSINGWSTTSLLNLTTGTGGVPLTLSNNQYSWIVSLTILGSMIGSLVGAYLADHSGRKYGLLICNAIFTTGWIIIYATASVETLYLARIIHGTGVGIAHTINPMYVSEIADIKFRGAVGALIAVNVYTGSLLTCGLGYWLTYKPLVLVLIVVSFISFLSNTYFPETPYFLVAQGQKKEACKSIAYYKGIVDSEQVQVELRVLRSESRYELQPQLRYDERQQSRTDLLSPPRSDLLSPSRSGLLPKSRSAVLSPPKSGLLPKSRSAVLSPSKSGLLPSSRSGLPSTSRSDLPSPSRSDLPSPSRSDLPPPSRSSLSPQSIREEPSDPIREVHTEAMSDLHLPFSSDIPSMSTTQSDAICEVHQEPTGKLRRQSTSDTRTQSRSDSRTQTRSDSRTQTRSDSRTQPKSDSRTQPRSDSRTQPRSDSRTQPRSDSRTLPRSDSRTQPRTDSRTQSRSSSRTHSRSNSGTQSRSDSRRQSIAESRTSTNVHEIQVERTKYSWSSKMSVILRGSNRRALSIMFGLIMAQQLSGNFVTSQYLEILFNKTSAIINPYQATILVECVNLVAGTFTIFTVDYAGRRRLLILSTLGSCFTLSILATYFLLSEHMSDVSTFSVLPIIDLLVYQATFQIGLGTIPNVLLCELFPTELKGFVSAILVIFDGMIRFSVLILFQIITKNAGSYTVYYIFTTACSFAFLMVFMWIPETKGKTYEEIEALLGGKNLNSSNEEVRSDRGDIHRL